MCYFALLFLLCLGTMGFGQSIAPRPNVVLVMADDQGWGDMAYNGHATLQTPNFDSAAAAGLRFDRFYAAAPVCSPTRASVLTGRHPNRSGVLQWGHPLRPQEVTLAELMHQAGYATAHFGKWHLGSVRSTSPVHPGMHGFQFWVSAPNYFDQDPILSKMGEAVRYTGESSLVTAAVATNWMRQQVAAEHRFLAVVWLGSPHAPHQGSSANLEIYKGNKDRHFLAEMTGMDAAFGTIRAALDELGVRNDTILWYCSDNGALRRVGSTGGFRGHKGQVYEGGLLVPAILEWPSRVKSHRATSVRCNTSDILPTLCELAGVSLPNRSYDGVSLVPLIDDRGTRCQPMGFWHFETHGIPVRAKELMQELWDAQQQGRELPPYAACLTAAELPDLPYSTDHFPGHAAWTDGDWKLHRIEHDQQVQWELYHLKRDPFETADCIQKYPDVRMSMQEPFLDWLESVVRSLNGEDYRERSPTP